MNKTVYVTGHKNPDSDSICSAIAYAELKKRFGVDAVPVRLGEINRETKFILDYFNVPIPELLTTVKTQISDLDIDPANPVSPGISIKSAWNIMNRKKIQTLPVVDDNEKLVGTVTLSDITNRYMDTMDNTVIASSNTPLSNIIDTLKAKLICGGPKEFRTSGKVVVAAMMPDEMAPYVEEGDIVIAGNRKDAQIRALQSGANLMILTCGIGIEEDVLELAKKVGAVVLSTAADTFTAARLINQSIPLEFIMTHDNIVTFRTDDYIDEVRDKMLLHRFRSYPVLGADDKIKGFVSRYHLISKHRKKVILVDHNEKTQTVDGIDQAELLEIVDHHRLGGLETPVPIWFKLEIVGSTATIIANEYSENGIIPSKKIAGILMAAIISDTLKFKSPTCTNADITSAQKLAEIAGEDIDTFALRMLKESSSLTGRSAEEILFTDYKDYILDDIKVSISQTNLYGEIDEELKKSVVALMETECRERKQDLFIMLFTDIFSEGSMLTCVGNMSELVEKAFGVSLTNGEVFLPGVVSRKQQVVPAIASAIENL